MSNRAWVTLATNDSYGLGALVLAHSLRRAGSAYPAVVLITPSVTDAMRDRLSAVFAEVVTVDVLDSGDAAHLALLQRPELGITFTKLHCWNLTQYEKCVFLDADTLVVQNCDELFEREELSAAPDVGWPDCFNSGVFVFTPSAETFNSLIIFAQERGSFDGGDQGLLNSYFSEWAHGDINKHLPFLYNVTSAAFYSYLPALKHYGQNLKIIHFIGAAKPWLQQFNWESRSVEAPDHLRELLQIWWDLFVSQVHSQLDVSMVEVEDIPTPIAPPEETIYLTKPTSVYNQYEPVLDPDSEFHWHHPGAQIKDPEVNVPTIDMTQFHDPWDIYRGHIAQVTDETKSTSLQVSEGQHDIRRHAWEPSLPQFQHHIEPHHTETHHNENHHPLTQHVHERHTETRQEINTPSTWTHSDSAQFFHHQNQHYHESQYNDYNSHNNVKEQTSTYSNDQHSSHQTFDTRNPNSSTVYQNHSTQEYYTSQNSDNFPSQNNSQHESLLFYEHCEPPKELHNNDQHDHPMLHDKCDEINSSQKEYHDKHSTNSNEYSTKDHSNVSDSEPQHNHYQNRALSPNLHNYTEQFTFPSRNRIEYVYCVHLDHEKEQNRQREKLKCISTTQEKVNGFAEIELDMDGHDDFIIPRHPYDGFYLRHRMTIDSRGRKICTHEIPPTPSPSPSVSPPESPIFFDAVSEYSSPEDTFIESDNHEHTGVAGTLARVSPGAIASQREALDELTRRQGWEAGNIDYMGADSFVNIWAKISQTLSQPPASPPEESTPPKELDQPSMECTEIKEPEVVSPPTFEEPKTDSLVESETPKEAPSAEEVSRKVDIPVETSAPASPPIDTPLKSDVNTPLETAVVPEPSSQQTQPLPIESFAAAITKEAVPTESPVSEVVSEDATIPVETADIPIESVPEFSAEIPVPVVEAVLAEAEIGDATATKLEEVPTPVIEATLESSKGPKSGTDAPKEEKSGDAPKPADATSKYESPIEEVAPEPVATEPPQIEASVASPGTLTTAVEALSSPALPKSVKSDDKPPKPKDISVASATDSPPLANTPSKEESSSEQAAKSEERRKPVGKLQLRPPAAADPLPTPDSEIEDADTLAQSIIASELRTPTVTSPSPQTPASPAQPKQEKRLSVEEPQVSTPPIGSVSLSQIGVKPVKGKSTIAAQIESSVSDKPTPASPTSEPKAPAETPKKKVMKKVLKKDSAVSGEAPVPPPRKKEKKPKEK